MILKKGMPWSVMGTRIHGGDLLPLELFNSAWSSRGLVGVPTDFDLRLMEPAPEGRGEAGERMGVMGRPMHRTWLVPTYTRDGLAVRHTIIPFSPCPLGCQELHWDIQDDLEDL